MSVRGLLLDVDGVLTSDGHALPGAIEAVRALRSRPIPFRLLTNSTVRSRRQLAERLLQRGFAIDADAILTPALAARARLERAGFPEVAFYGVPDLLEDLDGVRTTDSPGAPIVLLGDLGERFTYALLQEIFGRLLAGAELWALHRSAFWFHGGVIRLDLGAFVAALEFASGRPATVLGKPSPEAFLEGARQLGLEPSAVAMVGDDPSSDVAAARAAGLLGIQVRTGKWRPGLPPPALPADVELDSIADLPGWLSSEPTAAEGPGGRPA